MRRGYSDAVGRARVREPEAFDDLVTNAAFASRAPSAPLRQASDAVAAIYAAALAALPQLWAAAHGAAADAWAPGASVKCAWCVKHLLRAHEKLTAHYGGKAGALLDVARVSLVCATVAALRATFRALLDREGARIVRVKNRFAKPAMGYVDVLLNWRSAAGHVCEIQLHVASVYGVKGESGHQSYKWLRRLVQSDDTYAGPTDADGRAHGRGVKTFAAGDRYEGDYVHGQKHGRGAYHSADGTVYEGHFRRDKRHGAGAVRFANGNFFEGHYVDGVIEGRGTKRVRGGGCYVGDFRAGKPDGAGEHVAADGSTYAGAFSKGARAGKGSLAFANGDVVDATFLADRAVRGRRTYANGDRFEGEFDGSKDAAPKQGTLARADGRVFYEGRFTNGRPNNLPLPRSSAPPAPTESVRAAGPAAKRPRAAAQQPPSTRGGRVRS